MKLFRQLQKGDIIGTHGFSTSVGFWPESRYQQGIITLEPIELNPDPDAAAKAAYETLHKGFRFEPYEFKESFRNAAQAAILAGLPGLVAENEALKLELKDFPECLSQNDALRARIRDLEGIRDNQSSRIDGYMNEIASKSARISGLKSEINELKAERTLLCAEIAELTAPPALKLVPFDIERFKKEGEEGVVYRNGSAPKGITIMHDSWPDDRRIMSQSKDGRVYCHHVDGKCRYGSDFNLLMPAPVKRMKTLWVDVKLKTRNSFAHFTTGAYSEEMDGPITGWHRVEIQIPEEESK